MPCAYARQRRSRLSRRLLQVFGRHLPPRISAKQCSQLVTLVLRLAFGQFRRIAPRYKGLCVNMGAAEVAGVQFQSRSLRCNYLGNFSQALNSIVQHFVIVHYNWQVNRNRAIGIRPDIGIELPA